MSEKIKGRSYKFSSSNLSALGLQRADVRAFSQLYGLSHAEAASDLITRKVKGVNIESLRFALSQRTPPREKLIAKGRLHLLNPIPRAKAAREYYLEVFGPDFQPRTKKK